MGAASKVILPALAMERRWCSRLGDDRPKMKGHGAKYDRKKEEAIAALLTAFGQSAARLQQASGAAVTTLLKLMIDPATPPRVPLPSERSRPLRQPALGDSCVLRSTSPRSPPGASGVDLTQKEGTRYV